MSFSLPGTEINLPGQFDTFIMKKKEKIVEPWGQKWSCEIG